MTAPDPATVAWVESISQRIAFEKRHHDSIIRNGASGCALQVATCLQRISAMQRQLAEEMSKVTA